MNQQNKNWRDEFDKLMGQKERLVKQMGNVIITDSKQVTYKAIKAFIAEVERSAEKTAFDRGYKQGVSHGELIANTSMTQLRTRYESVVNSVPEELEERDGDYNQGFAKGWNGCVGLIKQALKVKS